jgi:hypothetical protein
MPALVAFFMRAGIRGTHAHAAHGGVRQRTGEVGAHSVIGPYAGMTIAVAADKCIGARIIGAIVIEAPLHM